jgi:four helix bundle protein
MNPTSKIAMCAANRRLPSFKKFDLGSRIRRAAVSLTNNVAEGHGRYHHLEQIKFCLQARGSLEELSDDLNICEDESCLPIAELGPLKQQGWRVHQLLNDERILRFTAFPTTNWTRASEAGRPALASPLQPFNLSTNL